MTDVDVEIADLIVLPHGAGALAKFHAQIGAVRLYGCELYRELDANGDSRGLRVRWPKHASVRGDAKKAVKNAAAEAWRAAEGSGSGEA